MDVIETIPASGEAVHMSEGKETVIYFRHTAEKWERKTAEGWETVSDPAVHEAAYQAHRKTWDIGAPYRGGYAPFGYKVLHHRLMPVPDQQRAILKAVAARGMGYSIRKIGRMLKEDGFELSPSAVHRIVINAVPTIDPAPKPERERKKRAAPEQAAPDA